MPPPAPPAPALRAWTAIALIGAGAAGLVLLRLLIGSGGHLSWPGDPSVLDLRAGRAACGAIVGAALGLAGLLLQSLLRNPLASPDILGIASGASLAVTISIVLGGGAGGAVALWHAGPALAGAGLTLLVIYTLSQRRGRVDPARLVLVGVMIALMCSAGISLVQHLSPDPSARSSMARLLNGGLSDDVSPRQLALAAAVVLGALALAVGRAPAMDAASMSEDEARSVGVRLGALRIELLAASGALTAAAVTIAGPIGFIGLVAPHAVRLSAGVGAGHRALALGSALAGAALVVGADSLVRALELGAGRLPLGVVTSILGGAAFIALLRSHHRSIT
jgi:iron complex transport system permease protein